MLRAFRSNRLINDSILWYVVFSLRERGVRASLALWQRELSYSFRYRTPSIIPRPFLDPRDLTDDADNHPYQGCYFEFIEFSVRYLIDGYGVSSIVDIGAGRGRVLKVSAALGMPNIIGIEINKAFAPCLSQLRAQHTGCIDILYGDALDVYPLIVFDVAFLFNPFSTSKLQRFLEVMNEHDVLPRFFICVNPAQYESALQDRYASIMEIKTGKHVELSIFKRMKASEDCCS